VKETFRMFSMRALIRMIAISLAILFCLTAGSEARAWQNITASDVSSAATWGPTVNGLRISLALDRNEFRVGDAVTATLYLKNLGPDRNVFLECIEWARYNFRIEDALGHTIARKPFVGGDCYTNPSSWPIKHDEVIVSTLRLNDEYDVTLAGSYTVTATSTIHLPAFDTADASGKQIFNFPILASLVSNSVAVTVEPALSGGSTAASRPSAAVVSPITATSVALHFDERGPEHGQALDINDSLAVLLSETDNCASVARVGVVPSSGSLSIEVTPVLVGNCEMTVKDSLGNSMIIPVSIAGTQPGRVEFLTPDNIPSNTAWGPSAQGLRLSIHLNQSKVQMGFPVLATVDLENLGPDREVSLGCDEQTWYEVSIADSQEKAIPRKPSAMDCSHLSISSSVGHNTVIESSIRLDNKYDLSKADSYTVTATSNIHFENAADSSETRSFNNAVLASLVSNAASVTVATSDDEGDLWDHYPAAGSTIAPGFVVTPNLVRLSMETNGQVYRLGEPIKVRIKIRNTSPYDLLIFGGSPWFEAALRVTDATSKAVPQSHNHVDDNFHYLSNWHLAPGTSIALQWKGQEWFDIRNFGFELATPGDFAISAVPTVGGRYPISHGSSDNPVVGPNRFAADEFSGRSNIVHIRIAGAND
jgi:hypothetical protein